MAALIDATGSLGLMTVAVLAALVDDAAADAAEEYVFSRVFCMPFCDAAMGLIVEVLGMLAWVVGVAASGRGRPCTWLVVWEDTVQDVVYQYIIYALIIY